MDETKSPHYALIIDKQRNKILTAFYQAALTTNEGMVVFKLLLRQLGVEMDEVKEFIKEWGEKEHELDWCESPFCPQNKKK